MVGGESYRELKYQELVANDEDVSRALFEWLSIPFHPAVQEFCELQQVERTPFRAPSRDLSARVTASQWRTTLNQDQQQRSLDLVGDGLVALGYETDELLALLRESLTTDHAPT